MPKISALPIGSALTGAEVIPLVQSGVTKSVTADDIATFIGATPGGSSTFEGTLSVKDFGAIGDGAPHALSTRYATLADAQVDYYFATSLSQQIDYCACKACSNAAFGADLQLVTAYLDLPDITWAPNQSTIIVSESYGVNALAGQSLFIQYASVPSFVSSQVIASNTEHVITLVANYPFTLDNASDTKYAIGYGEHGSSYAFNKQIYIPPGRYMFGNDTWTIRNLASGNIFGAGRFVSILTSNDCVLRFDGVWYTKLADFSCLTLTSSAQVSLDIDGNVPGHPYATRGVQGVTLQNMTIDAGMSQHAVALNRLGGSGGQGDHMLFLNVDFQSAAFACYGQYGYNSLANTIVGGNFQSYTKHGIYVDSGTIAVLNTGFQSTAGYTQILNEGYDIHVGDGGAFEGCIIYGCRSESPQFLNSRGAVRVDVRGCVQRCAMSGWNPSTSYGTGQPQGKAIIAGGYDGSNAGALFVATTEGTSGTVEPVWPTDGSPISDGTVVWTEKTDYYSVIILFTGFYDRDSNAVNAGRIDVPSLTKVKEVSNDYTRDKEDIILCDCTSRPITIKVLGYVNHGTTITVKKVDPGFNTVTILAFSPEGGAPYIIPGGAKGYVTAVFGNGVAGLGGWHYINESVNSPNKGIAPATGAYALIGTNAILNKSATYSSEASQFFARITNPGSLRKGYYATLIDALVSAGVWAKLDTLYMFAADSSATALTNLKSSSYGATTNNSPTFTIDAGYTGSLGSDEYINSTFNPSTASGNFAQNSASIFAWHTRTATSNGSIFGYANRDNGTYCDPRFSDGNSYSRINAGASFIIASSDGSGLLTLSRTASTNFDVYQNASSLGNRVTTSTALANSTLVFLYGIDTGHEGPILAGGFGSSLSAANVTALYNAVHAYLQNVAGIP